MKLKSILFGVIIGVALTVSSTALADSVSKIGKKVTKEYVVDIDGKTLPVSAIAFDGTSYLPIRSLSDELGLGVSVTSSKISLSTPSVTSESASPNGTTSEPKSEGGIVETTFKGLPAITVDGTTYFNWKSYNDKFNSDLFALGYDSDKEIFFYATIDSPINMKVLERYLEINKNDQKSYQVYKGVSYISVDHYKEASDFNK